jgi:hypothetical protein
MPIIPHMVKSFRGRQRKIIRKALKVLEQLGADQLRYLDLAILDNAQVVALVNPLVTTLVAALAEKELA